MALTQANLEAQPPFSIRLLDKDNQTRPQPQPQPPPFDDDYIQSLLPASYRTGDRGSNVAAASLDVEACIRKELDLNRLHTILGWMWMVGRPMPPRPLHYQLLLSRDIFLTEQMDMHLVWTTGRIFLKPIPRFLLEPRFWSAYLTSPGPCSCFREDIDPKSVAINTQDITARAADAKQDSKSVGRYNEGLRACALGFLFSYAALITHESDFVIAQKERLLPKEVKWTAWITLVKQLDPENIYDKIDERFKYGELRLGRLNIIYRFTRYPLLLGSYMTHWHQYRTFLQDSFTWLVSITVYFAIVLTAMQVGLALDELQGNGSFVSAAYGFTIFSILGPLVTAGLIIVTFLFIVVINWVATLRFWEKRSSQVHLWKPATKKTRKSATSEFV
ncbi:MAG: hypothetical protein M1821_009906 [Bathelium mastoideum]|nr:MAG: hypothetical protein M1821_009906 [Bathelium mastoideum]